jgi:taurine dioxygenase
VLCERIDHLSSINDHRVFNQGRGQGAMPDALIAEVKERTPFGIEHPLVRTHPETGKPALYLNGGFLRHESLFDRHTDETLDPVESMQIVTALLTQHGRPGYMCRFPWQAGSVAFWDNRAVQRHAASDHYPHTRVLRRVTISGDRPYNDASTSN